MDQSPSKTLQRQKSTTNVWFGRNPEDLPYRKLAPLQREIFAAYTGPADGLCLVEDLESKLEPPECKTNPFKVSPPSREICGSETWTKKNRKAYGIATSLYDQHPIKKCISGDPIADAFALCARTNNSLLVIADGVNWGEKSMLAARCAVYGAVKYINEQLFEPAVCPVKTTHDAFQLLLKAMEHAHKMILRHEGGLTTLCIALVCETRAKSQYAVCIANVGDSLAYVYSKTHGIREITTGSHDISSERDIRDAGGALGPVNGTNPELNNLTCSMTYVDVGDIIFLTTDGISDNYDPVVTKIAVAKQPKQPSPASEAALETTDDSAEGTDLKPSTSQVSDTVETNGDSAAGRSSKQLSSISNNTVEKSVSPTEKTNSNSMQESTGQKENGIENSKNEPSDRTKNGENLVESSSVNGVSKCDSVQSTIDNKNAKEGKDNVERISNTSTPDNQTQDSNLNVTNGSESSNFVISVETSHDLKSAPNVDVNTHNSVNTHVESVVSVQNTNSLSSQPPVDNNPEMTSQRQLNSGLPSSKSTNGTQEKQCTSTVSDEISNQVNANVLSSSPVDNKLSSRDSAVTSHDAKSKQLSNVESEPILSRKTAENGSQNDVVSKGQKRRSEAYADEIKAQKSSSKLSHLIRPKSRTLPVKSLSLDSPVSPPESSKSKNRTGARNNSTSGNAGTLSPCAEDFNRESFDLGTKDGKPEMAPHERHKYASKEMEKVVLEYELMTEDTVCAQELCGALLHHVLKLTNTKRNVLEDPNLYGKKLKPKERKARDSEIIARMAKAPGKLDHASIVGYEVGCFQGDADENYENRDRLTDVYGSHDDSECESRDGELDQSEEPKVETTPILQATPISPACDALDIPFIDDSEESNDEE